MTRTQYQEDLELLRTDVQDMADVVIDRFDDALEAYETGDEDLAQSVIGGDHDINVQYLDLESDCIELLALQQPVAGDLRFIAATFKILTDLERVGDLAVNLADYATWEAEHVVEPVEMRRLGESAGAMLEDAIDAYETDDADQARAIAARDDDLDRDCKAASEQVVREILAENPTTMTEAEIEARLADVSRTLLTIRDLERVGDHAVNVCARTLYLVENDAELIY